MKTILLLLLFFLSEKINPIPLKSSNLLNSSWDQVRIVLVIFNVDRHQISIFLKSCLIDIKLAIEVSDLNIEPFSKLGFLGIRSAPNLESSWLITCPKLFNFRILFVPFMFMSF